MRYHVADEDEEGQNADEKAEAVRNLSGLGPGMFPNHFLAVLIQREGWPLRGLAVGATMFALFVVADRSHVVWAVLVRLSHRARAQTAVERHSCEDLEEENFLPVGHGDAVRHLVQLQDRRLQHRGHRTKHHDGGDVLPWKRKSEIRENM